MILFAAGRGELLKRFLADDGVGTDARFWKLAQSSPPSIPVAATKNAGWTGCWRGRKDRIMNRKNQSNPPDASGRLPERPRKPSRSFTFALPVWLHLRVTPSKKPCRTP